MINSIVDGISEALNDEFGNGYEIYTENVEQGLKEPCFSIICINPRSKQFLGKRYFKQNMFCIHYFSDSNEKMQECLNVIHRMFDCLELITVGDDLIRGTAMNAETSEGVVSFFVNYDLFTYKHTEIEESMEFYVEDTDVKG